MTPLQMVSMPCTGGSGWVEGGCQQEFLVPWARVLVTRSMALCLLGAMACVVRRSYSDERGSPQLWLLRAAHTVPSLLVSSVQPFEAHVGDTMEWDTLKWLSGSVAFSLS